ncbi:MAG: hypothetical protein HY042_01620 [Spirochaetia bacterium]|nr:hypothetical protein [Spirochaetia bacterium]
MKRSNATVTYCNLETPYGHDSFLIRNPEFSRIVRNFLAMEYRNITVVLGLPESGNAAGVPELVERKLT